MRAAGSKQPKTLLAFGGNAAKALALWNAVLWTSAAVVALSFISQFALPAPKPDVAAAKRIAQEQQARKDIAEMQAKLAGTRTSLETLAWKTNADRIESESMSRVSGIARASKVKMNAFRPQKSAEQAGMERIPFIISLEGPYPNVLEFVRRLETSDNKLAVNLLQLTSAEADSDAVSATIGVFAFKERQAPAASEPGTAPSIGSKK